MRLQREGQSGLADSATVSDSSADSRTSAGPKLERREFLKLLGGGIVVFIVGGGAVNLEEMLQRGRRRGYPSDFNAYLRIGEDGRVTVFSGKIEMGQGVVTSLAQMAAEDLGVALDSIDMVMGDTALCPWDMGTFGSMSTRFFGPALRAAAAKARGVLVEMASEQLGVPAESLIVEVGTIFAAADPERRVTFAELAGGKPIARTVDDDAILAAVADFKVMGKPTTRLDGPDKVTGKALYAGDIRLPGMLYARILRPPAHGAQLVRVDTSGAERLPGVTVVHEADLVAVLHADPEAAEAALDKLDAEFEVPTSAVDDTTVYGHLIAAATAGDEQDARGDLAAGERAAAQVFERTYYNAYVAHAPMETHTAVARVDGEQVDVWASTQTPFSLQEQVARELGRAAEKVRVRTPFVGGGFGGKTENRQAVEAARLASITGRPVQVARTRAEEFFYDSFRPAAVVKVKSGIDGANKICLWDYEVMFAGSRGSEQHYDVTNNSIRSAGGGFGGGGGPHPFATGAWRAPGANTNVFAKESQIDVMAAAAGVDPLEFRLSNTSDERLRRVLLAAAESFGWEPAAAPSGRGRGIACGADAGAYVAHMAQVEVARATGRVRVARIVCAQDMGVVVNPAGAKMQMEGCITMGLGYALTEGVRFRGGQILDRNFDTYELPRFSWLPEMETILVANDDLAPQGGGEPAIIGIGAVLANAVFDATGARLFHLPMTPDRVRASLETTPQ